MKLPRILRLEVLEDRIVPVLYGVPWADPRHLTLSFVPDGTAIAGHQSTLFQTLDAAVPRAQWQGEILRAVETWASHAQLDIGLVADDGSPLGTPGLTQHDPRFGDIRIGAQAMGAEVLSVSVPHDPFLSGTWAGDIFLNSNYTFDQSGTDLYSVMLHELGHVFGLPDSSDPTSVMYPRLDFPRLTLNAADLAAIRGLYGGRSIDPGEGTTGNNTFATATPIPFPSGYEGEEPLVTYGDVSTLHDVDFYAVHAIGDYQGPMTFRVQSNGISLLEPKLTIYDAAGTELASSQSRGLGGDTLSISLAAPQAGALYYVKVESSAQPNFRLGRYALAVTFDGNSTVSAATLDAVMRGPYDRLSSDQIETIFTEPEELFNTNYNNHTFATALPLTSSLGRPTGLHAEAIGSLGDSSEVDYYRLRTPRPAGATTDVLTASVNALPLHGVMPQLRLFDSAHHLVAAQVLANGNYTVTIQVPDLPVGATYFLQVLAGDDAGEQVGNYTLVADFSVPADPLATFAGGQLTASAPQQQNTLYVAESQLFSLDLVSQPVAAGVTLSMTITDASGQTVYQIQDTAGQVLSGASVLLVPGAYTVTFTATATGTLPDVTFALTGDGLTDPIGPKVVDPTMAPMYVAPNDPSQFLYPNGVLTPNPFLWG
jgi:hypothetical protein